MKGFLDIETGGFSITKNGICEVAIIVVDDELNQIARLNQLIKPYKRVVDGVELDELVSYKDDAMKINGLTEEQLIVEGNEVTDVCRRINYFIQDENIDTFICHNVIFDVPRIDYLLMRFLNTAIVKELKTEDTLKIAKSKLPNLKNHKLTTLQDYFGIVNENQHSALGDVKATIEVYKHLISL